MFDAFGADLRHAVRTLSRRRAFTAAAILTLAVGIGATTAIFSVAHAVLLTPLAYPQASRLVFLSSGFPGAVAGGDQLSYLDVVEIASRTTTLEAVAAYNTGRGLQLQGAGGTPERVRANIVAPEYLTLLGAKTARGRLFNAADNRTPNGHAIVIVTHDFWQHRLGGDPAVIGRMITLSDVPLTVVGVLDASFRDVSAEEGYAFASDVFIPIMMAPSFVGPTHLTDRSARNFWGLARLKPGVTLQQAKTEVSSIGLQLQHDYATVNRGFTFWAERLDVYLAKDVRGPILVLLAASAFVLLIGCANVANLLLARLSGRARELTVRRALGAGRREIASLLLAECVALAGAGGAVGLALASWGADAFRWVVPGALTPRLASARLDDTTMLFAATVTFGVAVALAAMAALRVGRATAPAAAGETRGTVEVGSARLRGLLVVAEVASAAILIIAAFLVVGSLRQIRHTDTGFRTERLIMAEMNLASAKYANGAAVAQFGVDLVRRLRSIPGTESAMLWGPARPGHNTWITFPGREDADVTTPRLMTWRHTVNPGALGDLGIPLLRGRDFTPFDTASTPRVAIVSETLARALWPGQDPIGKRMKWRTDVPESPLIEIVGVARDAKHRGRIRDALYPPRDVYLPHAQRLDRMIVAVVRAAGDAAAIVPSVRSAVADLDPELPLFNVSTMSEQMAEEEAETRFAAALMSAYGVTALLLAAIGIYGVLSYRVTLRTREMAVRVALGASRIAVIRLVVADGMKPATVGVCVGVAGAAAVTRCLSSLLFRVQPRDPTTFAAVAAILAAVALASTLVPALRATRVEPMEALRAE